MSGQGDNSCNEQPRRPQYGNSFPAQAHINKRRSGGYGDGNSPPPTHMPTSTTPYEVIFEFTNDTQELHTFQVDNGATVLIPPNDNISLVLNAGSIYNYTARWNGRNAKISCVPSLRRASTNRFDHENEQR